MHVQPDYQDTVTRMYAAMMTRNQEESITPLTDQMVEAERLADELTLLLAGYQHLLEREGIRDQVETLKQWAECYRNGLDAASQISQNADSMMAGLQERTKFATEELLRFEDDGGPIANRHQAAETEGLTRMSRRLKQVAPGIKDLAGLGHQRGTKELYATTVNR